MTLTEAVKIMNLPEQASLFDVKKRYRELVHQWHPDHCKEDEELCRQKTAAITEAYQLIEKYITAYTLSLKEEDLKNADAQNIQDEFWEARFGNDKHWGG